MMTVPTLDKYSRQVLTEDQACNLLYENPAMNLQDVSLQDNSKYNLAASLFYVEGIPSIEDITEDIETYHKRNQSNWHMPQRYKDLDVAKYLLDLCRTDAELQRVGKELLLYQERDMFDLLRFLCYAVDTMRDNDIVWGVGRGSSVASYVLYLIGVHKIDSLYYDLDIEEFLR